MNDFLSKLKLWKIISWQIIEKIPTRYSKIVEFVDQPFQYNLITETFGYLTLVGSIWSNIVISDGDGPADYKHWKKFLLVTQIRSLWGAIDWVMIELKSEDKEGSEGEYDREWKNFYILSGNRIGKKNSCQNFTLLPLCAHVSFVVISNVGA